ncbi:thiolase family protein [Geodermatophilus sp. URMC 64]
MTATNRVERLTQALSGQVSVVGVGDTDYADDWRRARDGQVCDDSYGYAQRAFVRALADAGLTKQDVDGLIVGPTLAYERTAEVLGLDVNWAGQADAAMSIISAASAIVTGLADCIALVYGNDQKSAAVQYGGPEAMGGDSFLSYVYYAPWGFTSQGGLYALLTQRYMAVTGLTERGLGEVAVAQRMFASLNGNAVMRKRLDIEDYLASRYIVEPLHLYDYTIINDGGVALILMSSDRARARATGRAVTIRGLGRSDLNVDATSLRPRLIDFYHRGHAEAAATVYEVASCGPEDIDALQVYDSFSSHVPLALTGFGFCSDDDVETYLRSGAIRPGGRLPVNTSGGHLSESYMQGWNHQVEAVRQLRGEAGDRQVTDARLVQYVSDVAGKVVSLVYEGPNGRGSVG